MKPIVSIIVFTHNRRVELNRFMNMLKEQTYKEFEVLIADESSEHYSDGYDECRSLPFPIRTFQLPYQGNWGQTSKEALARRAHGDWLTFPNDDAVYEPTFLEELLKEATRTDSSMVLCDFLHAKLPGVRQCDVRVGWVDTGSFIVRREEWLKVGWPDKSSVGDGRLVEELVRRGVRYSLLHRCLYNNAL